jgi:hypothetical protein
MDALDTLPFGRNVGKYPTLRDSIKNIAIITMGLKAMVNLKEYTS